MANKGYVFLPYICDNDVLADPNDPNPLREKQIFYGIMMGEKEYYVYPPLNTIGIRMRWRERERERER